MTPARRRVRGKGQQGVGLFGREQVDGCHAAEGTTAPDVGHVAAPAHGVGLHVDLGGELGGPSGEERVAGIGHRSFHPGLVPRFEGPSRVDQRAVVGGQLGKGPVDQRVIEVRGDHPGLEVVGHDRAAGRRRRTRRPATWASTQERWSIFSTGRTNMSREKASTMMKPHTRRQRSVAGSNQRPNNP